MQAARLRRWRHQFPSWLARLGTSGFPEAAMATGLFLYVEVFTVPSGERTFEFAVNVLICGAAAASGRWPRLGAIGVAVGLGNGLLAVAATAVALFVTAVIPHLILKPRRS